MTLEELKKSLRDGTVPLDVIYGDMLTQVERAQEVVKEMRLVAENEGSVMNTRYVYDWADRLEGKDG